MQPHSRSDEALRLTRDLISIESHSEAPGQEAEVGRFLVGWFHQHGVEAHLMPVLGGRANVVARLRGRQGSDHPSLMLCGHLDTVPPGKMPDAFQPILKDEALWGRGACDMKGAVAAMAVALVRCRAELTPLRGDLLFVGTVDEETGGLGVKALVEQGIRADFAIVGEPTSLRVAIAHKGACFVRVSFAGRAAHGSCPEQGVSAVSAACELVRILEGSFRTRLDTRTHTLLGRSTVNVGRIRGGTQPNIVAEQCEVDIDRRTLPEESVPLAEIEEIVAAVCSKHRLSATVQEMAMTATVPHVALGTPSKSPVAQAAIAAADGLGLDTTPIGLTYWTDGGHLAACGIETVVIGPGDIRHAHGPSEHVPIAELDLAATLYGAISQIMLL
ncbi:ArgE/DapE family deacylase [Candidatus Bipolaricaulota bacterium]|nr:ArgE/DapE family deacylase [Candidatus Bipolaricaulota bacterium]